MTLSKNQIKKISSLKLKKFRENEGLFLIEGAHLIEECLSSEYKIEYILIEKSPKSVPDKLLENLYNKNIQNYELAKTDFKKISDTKNSQGIIAVVRINKQPYKELFLKSKLLIALDGINDPGNLGTIIRTAYWFGIDGIIIGKNSVDLYNPKVLRAAQGALFHKRIMNNCDLETVCSEFALNGFNINLFDLGANKYLEEFKLTGKNLYIFGNETLGISKGLLNSANNYNRLKLRDYSNCDSLNVSVVSGIVMHYLKNI